MGVDKMKLITVKSSNISQIGFEEGKTISFNQRPRNILRIVFTSGITYDFYNVPKDIYEDLLDAHSIGQYFHQNIKNRYDYEKRG